MSTRICTFCGVCITAANDTLEIDANSVPSTAQGRVRLHTDCAVRQLRARMVIANLRAKRARETFERAVCVQQQQRASFSVSHGSI